MKALFLSLIISLVICTPAHAFSLRKVLGFPGFVAGFTVAMAADLTVVPLYRGFKRYVVAPAVKGW